MNARHGSVVLVVSLLLHQRLASGQLRDGGVSDATALMDAAVASDASTDAGACAEGLGAVDRQGHCCSPGQRWDRTRCVGTPTSCPPGASLMRDSSGISCRPWEQPQGDAGATSDVLQTVASTIPAGMVRVPAGRFRMGARGTLPERWVSVSSFLMDRTEVTIGNYRRCVTAGRCEALSDPFGVMRIPSLPAVNVTHAQARAFCHFAGGRLPTEAEWEWAARGPNERTYPWGESQPSCTRANGSGCGERSLPVGSLPQGRNELGIDALAGNVAEWTLDRFATIPSESARDPVARGSGPRVVRGGSFASTPEFLRGFARESRGENEARYDLGFRCVR